MRRTFVNQLKSIAIGAMLFTTTGLVACGGNDNNGPLGNVDALVILQRPKRNDAGDIFQYTSYIPGARLVKLSPPTADGTLTTLCCDNAGPEFAGMDIQNYDLSFDAKQIVFAGHSAKDQHYGLYLLTLADGSVTQIASDPGRDYVSPIFLPGDKILFTTNAVVSNPVTDANPPQHRDEYERGTTIQVGVMNIDGTNEQLGPRNLSHRTMPSLASDGRVIFTQWDHLGPDERRPPHVHAPGHDDAARSVRQGRHRGVELDRSRRRDQPRPLRRDRDGTRSHVQRGRADRRPPRLPVLDVER
jgi:hypothetical protein